MAQPPVYLSEEEVARALAAFSSHDPERRGIRPCDLGPVFRAMGEAVTDTEVFDMMCDANVTSPESNTLPFDEVLRLLKERRQRLAAGVSPADLAMAFVACGGDPEDEESYIDKDMLIQLIKTDFGLSIDIEAMIEQIDEDGSGKIEFGEFETLLSTVIEMEGGGRRNPPPTPALDSYRQ